MKIEIKCRFSGNILFSHEAEDNTARLTLEAAVFAGANLDGANLAGAYLARANLAGANLDGEILTKAPISILNLMWPVLITEGFMRIGCQRHSHEEWKSFDDGAIKRMEGRAIEFWARWKLPLLAMCDNHAAVKENQDV